MSKRLDETKNRVQTFAHGDDSSIDNVGEYVNVPYYNIEASMGGGSFVENEQITDRFAFKKRWIREMGLDSKHLALITAVGDSMEPTLREGDILLIDLRQKQVADDGIYVLRLDDRLMTKRLQRLIDGAIIIMSDNPIYQKQTVKKDAASDLAVIGRAVWVGRRI